MRSSPMSSPRCLRERGGLAAPGARELGVRPFGVEVGAQAWTIALDGDAFTVRPGLDDAAAVVRLTGEQLDDLVNDLCTPMGLFTGGDLDMPVGRLEHFLDWWVVLRSVLDGVPAHTTGAVAFVDRDGAPLDLHRSFGPDDDRDDVAHFLGQAGFLHLRGMFDEGEMAAVSADMDAASPEYSRGDGRSWWARTADGADRLVRMQHFQTRSDTVRRLVGDERFSSISALCEDGHYFGKPGSNKNLVEALVKPIGVVEGISDVPWHKDCSLGSHSYRCCSLTVGISITGADDPLGSAARRRRLAPRAHPARVRAQGPRPPAGRPADGDRRRHRAPLLHHAHGAAAGRPRTPRALHPTSACPTTAPTPARPSSPASARARPPPCRSRRRPCRHDRCIAPRSDPQPARPVLAS